MNILIILCLCVATVTCDFLAPLYKSRDPVPNKYILKIKDSVRRSSFQRQFENRISTQGLKISGLKSLNFLNAMVVNIKADQIDLIRSMDDVEFVEEDSYVYEDSVSSWGLDRIDQDDLPLDDSFSPPGDGAGVNVYVLDTGIHYTHEEFEGRAHYGYDVIGDGLEGRDCRGHGTHCAGTIGGKTYGVAKKVTLWSVRVLNCRGSGVRSGTIEGMNWVIGNATGPSVVSMSLGGSASMLSNNAVSKLYNAGITVIVSAGNDNYPSCWKSPASAPKAITVGSTTDTDARSYFSNYGSCVDIFAPGSSIKSASIESNTATSTKSGTSMACPHVSGAVAIELGRNPSLSPSEVADTLTKKALVNKVVNGGPGSVNKLLRL
ncbi:aqualysin-1-like [Asterias rubens]|uniref:aqualysin-1-like n=1 Tax=Asterias rubens TaxID=7604 RepID=UPI001455711F|nr:aqualysin-1-like [Asterias rubens]